MALTGEMVPGETPLTEEDLKGLKFPWVKTRGQLSSVEGPNIVNGKEWALASSSTRMPDMLSIAYMQELHRRILSDVWEWAGEIRAHQLQNDFASSVPDIRPHLLGLYSDAVDYWLKDKSIDPDQFSVMVHHRVVKVHPFRNGNGRHSRVIADLVLEKHFRLQPFTWGGASDLGSGDANRDQYISALKSADKGEYGPLLKLCRAS